MLPIERAIDKAGSMSELARLLSEKVGKPILSQHVNNWRNRGVPAERCLAIEEVTKGTVSRYDLRPDVFGPAPSKRKAA